MPFHQHTLENGLQIIGETRKSARSMALGFFVRAGSRDETLGISGVTHFLEHMVFKGTPNRTALQVNQDFDRMGAHYNAFTSEEQTVFYAAILPEYMPGAVDLLSDILRPSLREEDFNTEKEVIIEEIGMYDDQPMFLTYDLARQSFFANHPLGNRVLGTADSIRVLTRDQMAEYFNKRYVPSNIIVVAAGQFGWDEFVSQVKEHCGSWQSGKADREGIYPTHGPGVFSLKKKDNVAQEHVMLLSEGPAVDSDMCYSANILTMILGDDSGSRLYWALVDRGLVDAADASFSENEGTGVYFTSFSCAPENAQQNLDIVYRLLHELQKDGVTDEELQQAKNKAMARMVRGSERPMGRMMAVGHMWAYLHTYRTLDEELSRYDAVSKESIRELLDKYPMTVPTTLALGPCGNLYQPAVSNGEVS